MMFSDLPKSSAFLFHGPNKGATLPRPLTPTYFRFCKMGARYGEMSAETFPLTSSPIRNMMGLSKLTVAGGPPSWGLFFLSTKPKFPSVPDTARSGGRLQRLDALGIFLLEDAMSSKVPHQFHPVNFTFSEIDKINLNLPRALALADVLTCADQASPRPEPESMDCCKAMLFELLSEANTAWVEGLERQLAACRGEGE